MIHLFNKIYIKGDHQFRTERDCIVISPLYGAQGILAGKFTQLANSAPIGRVFYQAKTYQQMIDDQFAGKDQAFFDFLLNYDPTKRLTIYADMQTAFYLVTRFYKTVLSYLSADTYVKLMKLTFLRVNYLFGAGFLPFVKIPQNHTRDYRMATEAILADTDKLKATWADARGWRLSMSGFKSIMDGMSVEFQLATYLATPNWAQRTAFEKKALLITKKALIHEFMLETKGVLLHNFVMLNMLEPQSGFNPLKDTLEDFVSKCPDYKFLTDDQFLPDNADRIWKSYNVETLAAIRDKVYSLTDVKNGQYVGITTPLWKRNLTFRNVLNFELISSGTKVLFKHDNYDETVNSYMVDLLLNAKRNGDQAFLKEFSLVRG